MAEDKRLTDAELWVEYTSCCLMVGLHGPHYFGERLLVLQRFIERPHVNHEPDGGEPICGAGSSCTE